MREFFSVEPTLHRMLVRFALAIGLLVLSAQFAALTRINAGNSLVLIGLAGIPALAVLIIEGVMEASATRLSRIEQIQKNLKALSSAAEASEGDTVQILGQLIATREALEKMNQTLPEAVARAISQIIVDPPSKTTSDAPQTVRIEHEELNLPFNVPQTRPKKAGTDRPQILVERERHALELSRERILNDLRNATNPNHRRSLQAALAHVEKKISGLHSGERRFDEISEGDEISKEKEGTHPERSQKH